MIGVTHALPLQPTPLIGREREVALVTARFLEAEARLVTLTGAGGTGKTRLAFAVAAALRDAFDDGVRLVTLDAIRDPALVTEAIATAIGVRDTGVQPLTEALVAVLAAQQTLLVLDNFEQVLAAAPLLAELLGACPRLCILVTSREPLHLRWEHEVPVAPLALPDQSSGDAPAAVSQSPAVALFLERAQAVRPDFALTAANAGAVVEVCRRLDGLPLAIELAAARVALFTPAALLGRLERRLELLTGGARDLPLRQQTFRTAIGWSYELLDEGERSLFRRLGVFVGGCTLEAAAAVANPDGGRSILEGVAALAEKNLVLLQEGPDGEPRVRLLETIREYALEQLLASGELEPVQRAHAAFYLALAETAEPHVRGGEQAVWLGRLEGEHDNLRAALGWSLEGGEAETALRLAGALRWFWDLRGYFSEGRRWLDRVLALSADAEPRLRALALYGAGHLAWKQGDLTAARPLYEAGLLLARQVGEARLIATGLNGLGTITHLQGEYRTARAYFMESLGLVQALDDQQGVAVLLNNLGGVAHTEGDYASARAHYEEGLALRRGVGDQAGIANTLLNLGWVARMQGEHETALPLLEESLTEWQALGDRRGIAYALDNLGLIALASGDVPAALTSFAEGLRLRRELGDKATIAESLEHVAAAASARSRSLCAARLLGAAEALRERTGIPVEPSARAEHDRTVTTVRAALAERTFASTWAAGRRLALEEAISEALQTAEDAEEGPTPVDSVPAPAPGSGRSAPAALRENLTPREVEVVRLLAGGSTNKDIAERLVLSVHTVERHVANIFTKLGARSRAEAAAYAVRHHLS